MPFETVKEQKRTVSGTDGFHCIRYKCDMRIVSCIERQRIHTRKSEVTNQSIIAKIRDECKDCEQGKIIMNCYIHNTPLPDEYAPRLSDQDAWPRRASEDAPLETITTKKIRLIPHRNKSASCTPGLSYQAEETEESTHKPEPQTGCWKCGDKIKSRGLCQKCYNAWYRERHKKNQAEHKKEQSAVAAAPAHKPVRPASEDPKSAGITPQKFKRCCVCKIHKPFKDFFKDKKAKDGLQSHCKSCNAAKNRIYRKKRKMLKSQECDATFPTVPKPIEPSLASEDEIIKKTVATDPHPEFGPMLTINFQAYSAMDLIKDFEEYSARAFRTPEGQALYLIRQFIEEQKARRKAGIETIG